MKAEKDVSDTDHYKQLEQDSCHYFGNHETHESVGGEVDLHKIYVTCKKNPDHAQFIPIHKFSLQHLPDSYRNNDLYEYIKAVADLTVLINVKKTSPHRPQFWPKTSHPYPFFKTIENEKEEEIAIAKTKVKTGSGMVYNVSKFENGARQHGGRQGRSYTVCWCKQCEQSDSPSTIWFEFDVYTATHVVFDEIEANHTSLRLFHDSERSPKVLIDKVRIHDALVEYDRCWIKCVTCQVSVGVPLEQMWTKYLALDKQVTKQYTKSRDKDKVTFVVSHPHGCPKHVSVGRWNNIRAIGESKSIKRITYSTGTCPGSSGANVHCIGYTGGRYRQLAHSGSLPDGSNTSGAGWVK
ncbi:hypothetical protein BgiBS90_020525 [Biomphalaria glabrata]|nr:hypothetical protein BgiBS90_020525 [Biomphalaria glabrata]